LGSTSYRFWPAQSFVINWGPSATYGRVYGFDDVLQDENLGLGLNVQFVRSVSVNASFNRNMERFSGTEYETTGFSVGGNVNTSRSFSLGGNFSVGETLYYADRVVGDELRWSVNGTIRPTDRIQTGLNFSSNRLTDPTREDLELYDVKILRANTNIQFTDRFGLRNIVEYSTQEETFDLNLLFQYRVNAGTVVYLGYDDHYQQADLILGDQDGDGNDEQIFFDDALRRTNRAIFVKAQYLLRY
jgi:hypothetical protein